MPRTQSTSFECPNCAAKYEVVRVEAGQGATTDREITCVSCGGPLHGREGPFLLKYFLVDQTTRWQALSHSRFSERAKQTPREIFPSMT
jgi:predicted RNA-binding Zn-ribbon protein involved in translation (DUF1610 family)